MRITPGVYLDHNATAPLQPQIIGLMTALLAEGGNASSVHAFGRTARKRIEDARAQVAALTGVATKQVIFNSGATEANNTILSGFAGKRILISAIEHPSLYDAGVAHETIPVDAKGVIDLDALEAMLTSGPAPALASVMLVNNETGVIQPVAAAAALARKHGAIMHTDATQAVGRIPVDFTALGVDFMSLSSHKIGGPTGAGALIMAPGAPTPRLLRGGGQERRQRAGTENVAAIAGFGMAADMARDNLTSYAAHVAPLRDRAEAAVKQTPGVRVYGHDAPRVANTLSFTARGASSETWLMNFDLAGIALSSGSACSSGSIEPSRVLIAMGAAEEDARSSLRVSLGPATTDGDIDNFIAVWNTVSARLLKGE